MLDEPGQEPGEPALFLADASSSNRSVRPNSFSPRRSASPIAWAPSTRPSRRPIRRATPARRPSRSLSPALRPAGKIRLAVFRTPCACRPAWCRTSTARAPDQRADLIEPVRLRRAASRPVGQSAGRASDHPACRSDGGHGGDRPRPEPGRGAHRRQPGTGAAAAHQLPELRRRLSARLCADVPLMRGRVARNPRVRAGAWPHCDCLILVIVAAIHFARRSRPCVVAAEPRSSHDPLARELARCQAIGRRRRTTPIARPPGRRTAAGSSSLSIR